jgi:Flp pilus assembly protein TadG
MRDSSMSHGERKVTFGRKHGERGADIVEAAFVLPIVLTLVFALYSFGHAWSLYETMTRAAREGVHEAVTTNCAMCGDTSTSATDVQNDIVFPALQAGGIDTTSSVLTSSYHQGVAVLDQANNVCGVYITFSYPDNLTIPFLPWRLTTLTLTTRVQMRYENQPSTCSPS